jgi:superfamily II RNA helicase
MCGRAGRRGKDDLGHVIIFIPPIIKQIPPIGALKKFVTTTPSDLESKFRITYRMIACHRLSEDSAG